MPSSYPSRIDIFDVPTDPMTALSSPGDSKRNHYELHKDQGDAMEAVQANVAPKSHNHNGTTTRFGSKLSQANTHENADTDKSVDSIHHTLSSQGTPRTDVVRGSTVNHSHLNPLIQGESLLSPTLAYNPNLEPSVNPFDLAVEPSTSSVSVVDTGTPHLRLTGQTETFVKMGPTDGVTYLENNAVYNFAVSVKLPTATAVFGQVTLELVNQAGTLIQAIGLVDLVSPTTSWRRIKKQFAYIGATGVVWARLKVSASALPLSFGGMTLYRRKYTIRHAEVNTIGNPNRQFDSGVYYINHVNLNTPYYFYCEPFLEVASASGQMTDSGPGDYLIVKEPGYYSAVLGEFINGVSSGYQTSQYIELVIRQGSSTYRYKSPVSGIDFGVAVMVRQYMNVGDTISIGHYSLGGSKTLAITKPISITYESI